MKKFKRNIIVLFVLVFVCAAVYLNWSYNQKENDAMAENATETGADVEMSAADSSEDAKDAYFQAVMKAYLDCKEAAKQTYGRKKDN